MLKMKMCENKRLKKKAPAKLPRRCKINKIGVQLIHRYSLAQLIPPNVELFVPYLCRASDIKLDSDRAGLDST